MPRRREPVERSPVAQDILTVLQTCTKCGKTYPLTAEYWHKRDATHFKTRCKTCLSEIARLWHLENAERAKAQKKKYLLVPANREHHNAYIREYVQSRPEVAESKRRHTKEWRERHPNFRAYSRQKQREYFNRNHERYLEMQRSRRRSKYHNDSEYRASRIAKAKERRATRLNLPVKWDAVIEREMFEYFDNRCVYCGSQQGLLNSTKIALDHFIPLNSGSFCPGTVPWNIVPACKTCNSKKRDRDPEEFLRSEFGARSAKKKLKFIKLYFELMRQKHSSSLNTEVTDGTGR